MATATNGRTRGQSPVSRRRATGSTGKTWRLVRKNYDLYLLILPSVLLIGLFAYGPMYGIQLAFKDFFANRGIWGSPWVGLKHFSRFFSSFYATDIILNTIRLSLYSLVAGFPFPILLALMLNEVRQAKFKKLVQTVTYAPNFISTVVMVGMLLLFLAPGSGMFNNIRGLFGLPSLDFMSRPELFSHIYVWSGIWQGTGWGAIIYIAALSGIDQEQYDAALIDGATKRQRIIHINIPGIMPTVVMLLILNAGGIMNVGFEKVFLMQNQLNLERSDVISTYIYRMGITNAEIGLSTAVGLFNTLVNLIMLVTVNFTARRLGETSLW